MDRAALSECGGCSISKIASPVPDHVCSLDPSVRTTTMLIAEGRLLESCPSWQTSSRRRQYRDDVFSTVVRFHGIHVTNHVPCCPDRLCQRLHEHALVHATFYNIYLNSGVLRSVGKVLRDSRFLVLPAAGPRLTQFLTNKYTLLSIWSCPIDRI